jgi:hypothetical protein
MKKVFVISMLIPLAMVCSCQKQDTLAEQQLAQRKADLDTREKALDDREKALAERETAVARAAMLPADAQLRALRRNPASNVQPSASVPSGLAPSVDAAQVRANREKRMQELRALRQKRLEAIQEMRSLRSQSQTNPSTGAPADTGASSGTSGALDTSASPGSGTEATSASPSPTP